MSDTIIVAYDGSAAGRRAVDFAAALVRGAEGSLVLLHVLEWSPYSFLTPDEVEERHARRKVELARAESAIVAPVKAELEAAGLKVDALIRYGNVTDTICEVAQETGARQIVIGRTGQAGVMSRLFGSVAGALAQVAPVPCTIVP
ncbi:universal stress protein [Gemmobacter denitrificans]|uniref:Universal stress protein n=1 Tax=Gemmobacter denitrificans TaxID=3123040 RepID=A0ABU8BUS1_9RHOB